MRQAADGEQCDECARLRHGINALRGHADDAVQDICTHADLLRPGQPLLSEHAEGNRHAARGRARDARHDARRHDGRHQRAVAEVQAEQCFLDDRKGWQGCDDTAVGVA